MNNEIQQSYLDAGLCVLRADAKIKKPQGYWKEYQSRLPTKEEIDSWTFRRTCIVAGTTSGNLECIDFDQAGRAFEDWKAKIPIGVFEKLTIERTSSGGYHVIYRCSEKVDGSRKLARTEDKETLIESKAERSIFLCDPSEGYDIIQNSFQTIPTVSPEQRTLFLNTAIELDELSEVEVDVEKIDYTPTDTNGELRPGSDYNARGDINSLLERHGWKHTSTMDGNDYWRRPGKTSGCHSASWNGKRFYVFSTNAHPLDGPHHDKFGVYMRLEYGGSGEAEVVAATRALGEEGYGGDGYANVKTNDDVDLTAILASLIPEDNEKTIEDPGPTPERLMHVPGFIDMVIEHTMNTAVYPDLSLAFCGAVALQGHLSGRKVTDKLDTRTNIYILGLGRTGTGKNGPRKTNAKILRAINREVGDGFGSGEGIEKRLAQCPCFMFQTDEIDGLMGAIKAGKEGRYEFIQTVLLKMYTSADGDYPIRALSSQKFEVIDQPSLTIFGTAIPRNYYETQSVRMQANGFFARWLVVEGGKRKRVAKNRAAEPSKEILDIAHHWDDLNKGGNLSNFHPKPIMINETVGGEAILEKLAVYADKHYDDAERKDDESTMGVWSRVYEKTRRLALIYACSANYSSPIIDADAAKWAWEFVEHQTRRMLYMLAMHSYEDEFHAKCQQVLTVLRTWRDKKGNAWMPYHTFRRKLKWDKRTHDDVREALCAQDLIEYEEGKTKGRPSKKFRLLVKV